MKERENNTLRSETAESDRIETVGIIVELVSDTKVRIALPNGHKILAVFSGEAKVKPGDKVKVEMSPFDLTRGRIVESKQ